MTLHQLFTLTTIEHRHLLLAYVIVALVQLSYLAVVIRGLVRAPADVHDAKASRSLRP